MIESPGMYRDHLMLLGAFRVVAGDRLPHWRLGTDQISRETYVSLALVLQLAAQSLVALCG